MPRILGPRDEADLFTRSEGSAESAYYKLHGVLFCRLLCILEMLSVARAMREVDGEHSYQETAESWAIAHDSGGPVRVPRGLVSHRFVERWTDSGRVIARSRITLT